MIRTILLSFVMLVIGAYLVVAITAFNVKPPGQVCDDIELLVKDSLNTGFITKGEVISMLKKNHANPVGRGMDSIRMEPMEKILATHPLIDEVECYKTPTGKVHVEVTQRIPILRIMARNGENYYIDNKGEIMPPESRCIAHLVVVTGYVDKEYATAELYPLGLFLQKNAFWDSQIEQLNVLPTKEIEMVPRVGDHIVFLGKLEHYEDKLYRLKEFYQKALNKVGWNKYKRISLEFDNQIICTKRI